MLAEVQFRTFMASLMAVLDCGMGIATELRKLPVAILRKALEAVLGSMQEYVKFYLTAVKSHPKTFAQSSYELSTRLRRVHARARRASRRDGDDESSRAAFPRLRGSGGAHCVREDKAQREEGSANSLVDLCRHSTKNIISKNSRRDRRWKTLANADKAGHKAATGQARTGTGDGGQAQRPCFWNGRRRPASEITRCTVTPVPGPPTVTLTTRSPLTPAKGVLCPSDSRSSPLRHRRPSASIR